ncbi:hypothetical protein M8494_37880 [Serratia ureilytica]
MFAADDSRLIDTLDTAIADAPMELMNALQGRWSKQDPSYLDTGNADLTTMEKNWVASHRVVLRRHREQLPVRLPRLRRPAARLRHRHSQHHRAKHRAAFRAAVGAQRQQADLLVQSGQGQLPRRPAAGARRQGALRRQHADPPFAVGVYVGQHADGISTAFGRLAHRRAAGRFGRAGAGTGANHQLRRQQVDVRRAGQRPAGCAGG